MAHLCSRSVGEQWGRELVQTVSRIADLAQRRRASHMVPRGRVVVDNNYVVRLEQSVNSKYSDAVAPVVAVVVGTGSVVVDTESVVVSNIGAAQVPEEALVASAV
jgi:hypothetical protein